MRDSEWSKGWTELSIAYPPREEADEVAASRANLYRKHLDDVPPEAWLFAVTQAIRSDSWCPTIARLRDFVDAWRPPVLPALPPSEEEREEQRAASRKGLELVMEAVAERTGEPAAPAVAAPPEPLTVEATEDRLALLRAQAEAIKGAEVTA